MGRAKMNPELHQKLDELRDVLIQDIGKLPRLRGVLIYDLEVPKCNPDYHEVEKKRKDVPNIWKRWMTI